MSPPTRRQFLSTVGASAGLVGTAGCLGTGVRGSVGTPDRSVYVGAYHWGFVLLDERGTEHEQLVFDRGTTIRLVAFSTRAEAAIAKLPPAVTAGLPDHEGLEERNADRMPSPPSGTMHDALEAADQRYPDHSLAITPMGYHHMRGPMGGEMMRRPIALPHDAARPAIVGFSASTRGYYTIRCATYCGYGHPYMALPEAFVVQ